MMSTKPVLEILVRQAWNAPHMVVWVGQVTEVTYPKGAEEKSAQLFLGDAHTFPNEAWDECALWIRNNRGIR